MMDRRPGFIVSSLLVLAFAGCGGGGNSSTAPARLIPVPLASASPASASGPVAFLQSDGPLSSSGTISQGSRAAIIAVMSGADAQSSTFETDTLLVGTSGSQSQSGARRAQRVPVPAAPPAPVEAFPADEHPITPLLTQTTSRGIASRSAMSVIPASPTVGSQAPIWVLSGTASNRHNVQVPATLLAQSTHGNIWVDDSLIATLTPNSARLVSDFENAYASDTAHFAWPDYPASAPGMQPQYNACSAGGATTGTTPAYIPEPPDHRINVMIVNAGALGGLGGYFSGANYMRQSALNCLSGDYKSNEAPFIFVAWFAANGSTYNLQEDLVRSTAHELQHLINFVNHGILAPGAVSAKFNGYETTFINEGLSMLAQDYAVQSMYGSQGVNFDVADALQRASVFLANPGAYSLSGFIGVDPANWGGGSAQYNCFGGCYGVAYLFERYLRDRFGGDAFTRAMETSGQVGVANLQSITGEPAGQLQDDFALAMAASTMGLAVSDRRFDFGSLSLTASYRDQFGRQTQLSGVYAPVASGSSTAVQAPVGGFTYVSIPAVPSSGMPVQVTDEASVSGFDLIGGLSQH